MTRERLTWRKASMKKEADPNSLGRPDRKNPPVEKYMNYEFTTNHPYPDLRHQWKEDQRLDTGHPAPVAEEKEMKKEAAALLEKKAHLALKLAEKLHPQAAADFQVAQAANYMEMSDQALMDTYKAVETAQPQAVEEEEPAEGGEKLEELLEGKVEEAPAEEAAAEAKEGVDQEVLDSVMKIVEDTDPVTLKELVTMLAGKAGVELATEEVEGEMEVEPEGEMEVEGEMDEVAEEKEEEELFNGIDLSPINGEVEAIPMNDEELDLSGEDEEVLAALFDSPRFASVQDYVTREEGHKVTQKTASTKRGPAPKKGVQSLGGVRSKQAARKDELSQLASLWKSDPDVTHIFE